MNRSSCLRALVRRAAALLLLLLLAISTTGCFGRFPITRSAYRFNQNVSHNEFLQTLTFWGMLITFYPYGLVGDLIFLNPVEFWSGESLELGDDRRRSEAPATEYEIASPRAGERPEAIAFVP